MRLKTLRKSLQPSIDSLTDCADYWSEMHMRGKLGDEHYIKVVKTIEDLKLYVLDHERKSHEELRLSSRTNGGLQQRPHDQLEDSGIENFG